MLRQRDKRAERTETVLKELGATGADSAALAFLQKCFS